MSKRAQVGHVVLRNGKWIGRYYVDVPDRRIRKALVLGLKSEMTKPAAKRKLQEALTQEGVNSPVYLETVLGTAKTFGQIADAWELKRLPKLKESSRYASPMLINKHLRPYFGTMAIKAIKTGTINDWIESMVAKRLSPKTIINMYKLFHAIVNWHFRQEDQAPPRWSPDLPALKLEEQRWFTAEEALKIIEEAKGQYKVLFDLAFMTGMRCGELCALRVEDIDFANQMIRVQRSVWNGREQTPKTEAGCREVYIASHTIKLLQEHIGDRTRGRVFSTRNGTPLDVKNIVKQKLHPICDALKIPRGGMHAFRHGHVSQMRMAGVPDDIVKRTVGHSSLKITSIYSHYSAEFQRGIAEKLATKMRSGLSEGFRDSLATADK